MKLIEVLNALIPLRALTEERFTSFKKSRELAILRFLCKRREKDC